MKVSAAMRNAQKLGRVIIEKILAEACRALTMRSWLASGWDRRYFEAFPFL
jgi:hypothetical protein